MYTVDLELSRSVVIRGVKRKRRRMVLLRVSRKCLSVAMVWLFSCLVLILVSRSPLVVSGFVDVNSNSRVIGTNGIHRTEVQSISALCLQDYSSFPYLYGKNLVSVDNCVRAQRGDTAENRVVFVDASWFHKGNRNPRKEFERDARIRKARYFDIDDVALSSDVFQGSNTKSLPHTMPSKAS